MSKALRWIRWPIVGIALIALAMGGLPLLPLAYDAFSSRGATRYLHDNAEPLTFLSDRGDIVWPDQVDQARFIMLSAPQGLKASYALNGWMIRHLANHKGTRIIISEWSPGQAIALNQMVIDGNETLARQVFAQGAARGAVWSTTAVWEQLERLKTHNLERAPQEKTVFLGIDKPPDRGIENDLEQKLLRSRPGPAPSFRSLTAIRAINQSLLGQASARDEAVGRYGHILPGLRYLMDLPGADGETFYGLWGPFHGSKVTIGGAKPLALLLQEEGPFKDSVVTMRAFCLQRCLRLMPTDTLPQGPTDDANQTYTSMTTGLTNPYRFRMRGAGELLRAMDRHGADALWLPLAAQGSPYLRGPRLTEKTGYLNMLMPGFEHDGAAADMADVAIVVRDSPALVPWPGEGPDSAARRAGER